MRSVAVLLISFLLYSISHSEPDPEDPLYDIDNYYVLIRHPIIFDVKDINITSVVDYAARQSEFEVYNRSGMVPPPFEDFPFPRLLDEHATYVTYPPESEIAELMHLSTKPGPSEEKPEKDQTTSEMAEENQDKKDEKHEHQESTDKLKENNDKKDEKPKPHGSSEKSEDSHRKKPRKHKPHHSSGKSEENRDKKQRNKPTEWFSDKNGKLYKNPAKRDSQSTSEKPNQEKSWGPDKPVTDAAQVKSEGHKLSQKLGKPETRAALEKPAMKQVIRARRHLE